MKLAIHQDVKSHELRQSLAKSFELITQRLGITDYNRIVQLSIEKLDDVDGNVCGGCMSPLNKGLTKFHVKLNANNPSFVEALVAFCHEMIHVKQYLTGALTPDPANNRVLYFGQALNHLPYESQPYEQEALTGMWPLARYVVGKLGESEGK